MKTRLILIVLLCSFFGSQLVSFAQTDSSMIYGYDAFINRVKQYHPVSFQANLKTAEGEAYILKAKGSFDPKIGGEIQQKYFDGKQYYSDLATGLKIPTWFGISGQIGFDQGRGDYLNGQLATPENGLWHAGLEVNLGRGLLIDERRAELKQARIYAESAEMERQLMLNELIYDASVAYWEWFKAFNYLQIVKTALTTSEIRYENVKQLANLGDKPAIDTVEAAMQFQNQQVNFEQTLLDWKNKTQKLEIYLWQDGIIPLELDTNMIPASFDQIAVSTFPASIQLRVDSVMTSHPKLQLAQYKIDFMRVENRLNRDALKPVVALKYNALSAFTEPDFADNYSVNNYNWGAKIAYPIFTRKERGMIRLSNLKIQSLEADFSMETQKLRNNIQMALNLNETTSNQVEVLKRNVDAARALFEAEQKRYLIGESSLFMVNTRELSFISAQQKMIEMLTNNAISKHFVNYQLAEEIQ